MIRVNKDKTFFVQKKLTHLKKKNPSKNKLKLPNSLVSSNTKLQKQIQNVEPINTSSTKEILLTVFDCMKYVGNVFKEMLKDSFISPIKDLLKK